MENSPYGSSYSNLPQSSLPNATAVLVLGIISLPACLCYGIPGLITAIIALVLAKKDQALYAANPSHYTEASYKNLRNGRTCAWIGIILSALFFLMVIGVLLVYGFSMFSNPDLFIRQIQ